MGAARQKRRGKRTPDNSKHSRVQAPPSAPLESPAGNPRLSIWRAAFSGRALWVCGALILVNMVVYAPVRHHDFVGLDDPLYVPNNPDVSRGLTLHGVWWAFTTGHMANWHPLTWLSHMLDVQVYGLSPGGHHLTSVLFHIANTLLLFGLLQGMTGALGRSAFVAALFAVHPLHVESVAWVSERKDVLSALFFILTLWAYVWYVERPERRRYAVVMGLFALGLMAKPMVVTLPFVLLLLDVWPLGRVSVGGATAGKSGLAILWDLRSVGLQLAREKLPLLVLAVASSIVTFVVQNRAGAVGGLNALPLHLRVENALVSYIAYIGKMLWPARLAAFYPYSRSLPGWWVAGAMLVLIAVSVVAIRKAWYHPYLPVGWLWYLGTLVPVIGLVQVGDQAMADRYTYVPLIGLFIMGAWGIPDLLARWSHRRMALPTAAVLAILACTVTARGQVQYWKDSIVLWEHTLEVTTENHSAHAALAGVLADQGRVEEAIAQYSEAVRLRPDIAQVRNNLGLALAKQGKFSEAIAQYSEALRLKPDLALAYNNLGVALAKQGKFSEAIAQYSEALRLSPDFADAHNNLGLALVDLGRVEEAIAQYSEALRLKPDLALAYNNLGVALAKQGKFSEAIAQYSEALRLKPDFADAHNKLGIALVRQRRLDEAVEHFSEALRIEPGRAEVLNNLGVALADQGSVREAIARFSEALRLKPDFADARNNLLRAQAKQGKIE